MSFEGFTDLLKQRGVMGKDIDLLTSKQCACILCTHFHLHVICQNAVSQNFSKEFSTFNVVFSLSKIVSVLLVNYQFDFNGLRWD